MAVSAGTAYVSVRADTSGAAKDITGRGSHVWRTIGGLAAAAFAVGFAKSAFSAAQTLAKSTQRFQAVAQENAKINVSAAEDAAKRIGDATAETTTHIQDLMSTLLGTGFQGTTDELARQAQAITDIATASGKSETMITRFYTALNSGNVKSAIALSKRFGLVTQEQTDAMTAQVKAGHGALVLSQLQAIADTKDIGIKAKSITEADKLGHSYEELKASLGTLLTKGLNPLLALGVKVLDWLHKASPATKTLIGILAALVGAIVLVVKAIKAWEIVQAALDVLLSANPIGLVVIAIAALIAGIILVVKYWDRMSLAVKVGIIVFAPFIAIPALIIKHWGVVAHFLSGVWNAILLDVSNFVNAFVDAINLIIHAWNLIPGHADLAYLGHVNFGNPNWDKPGYTGAGSAKGFGGGHRSGMAAGGIVTRPTDITAGEAGPEAIIPLGHGGMKVTITDSNLGLIMSGVLEDATAFAEHAGRAQR